MIVAAATGRRTRRRRAARRGVVLVAVLALLTLCAALIAGAFAAARGATRATRTSRAGIVAHAAARRALVRTVTSWAAEDSLGVGAFVTRTFAESGAVAMDSAESRVHVQRLSATLFVVAAEASVPSARAPIARRRMRVLLERAPTIDSTIVSPLRPLARWNSADLY